LLIDIWESNEYGKETHFQILSLKNTNKNNGICYDNHQSNRILSSELHSKSSNNNESLIAKSLETRGVSCRASGIQSHQLNLNNPDFSMNRPVNSKNQSKASKAYSSQSDYLEVSHLFRGIDLQINYK